MLPAKLTAPKTDGAISRTRLFQLLDQAREKPVVWISAPAGSGKTTLIASYLAYNKIRPLWYQIDVRDTDPAAFFSYLRQAVTKLAPRKRETLPRLTAEYALGLPAFTLNFFEQLFARLRPPAFLVFDNFQELPSGVALHGLMEILISVIPESSNVIFISRDEIPPEISRFRASRQIAVIEPSDLLFSADEAMQLGKEFVSAKLSKGELARLNERAGGWAAGLILLLENETTDDLPQNRQIDITVFNYFAAEIIRLVDRDTQKFLMCSALLPVMDAASASAMTGNPNAGTILQNLVRKNYFISRHPGKVMRYEYHPLFRDYLLSELKQQNNQQALLELQKRAGRILLEAGEYAMAADLLTHAAATDELMELVLAHAEQMLDDGCIHTLTQWIQGIPESVRQQQPWLMYWCGVSRMSSDPIKARDSFARAFQLFNEHQDVAGQYRSWAGIAESFVVAWDDFTAMHDWMDSYQVLRQNYPDYPSIEIENRVQAALFGVLMYVQPQHPELELARANTEQMLVEAKDPDLRIKLANDLALHYSWVGDFEAHRRVVEIVRESSEGEVLNPLSRLLLGLSRGTLLWLSGNAVEAEVVAAEMLSVAETWGIHYMDTYSQALRIYARGTHGDLVGMGEALQEMQKCASPQRRLDLAHYHYLMGWYKSLCGEFAHAVAHARQGLELATQTSVQMPIALCQLGLGKALAQTGEYVQAHGLLDKVMTFAQEISSKHLEFMMRINRAYIWLLQKEHSACEEELRKLLFLGAENSYVTFYGWDGGVVSQLLEFALQRGIETNYVCALIRKWKLLPKDRDIAHELWPWQLKVYTFGRFSLVIDGKAENMAGKNRGRVLELMKVIIALGGREISESKITDILWPDAEGDMARQNFRTTLHRLRKIIGSESIIVNDGKVFLNADHLWVDSWSLDRLLTALDGAKDAATIKRLSQQIFSLYSGGFLQQENYVWLLPIRERLRSRYLRIIEHAADRLCELNHWDMAIECYQRVLEVEPLAEQIYLGLMRCYYHLGKRAEGLIVYHRCREILANELSVIPSMQTEQCHALLQQQDNPYR